MVFTFPSSHVVREMQNKITLGYYLSCLKLAKVGQHVLLERLLGKQNFPDGDTKW